MSVEDAARAEAERRAWTMPPGKPYVEGVTPTDVEEWIEDAFVAGAVWLAQQYARPGSSS